MKQKLNIRVLAPGELKMLLPFARKRLEQFLKLNETVNEAEVKLTYGHHIRASKVCEIYLKMNVNSKNIFAKEETGSFEESIDKTLRKLQNQIKIINTH